MDLPTQPTAPLRIAVLISGGGTTLRNLLDCIERGELNVVIDMVISSDPAARGLQFAADAGIATRVVRVKDFETAEAFSAAVFGPLREAGVELVVMGGFLKHVLIPPDFENRVVNIHPGLIPAFCGKGMYGLRVHAAVLEYGAKVTGCTVHFVDNQYDHGPIILQRVIDVLPDDDPQTLQRRVIAVECEALPAAVALIAQRRVRVDGRRVIVE
ncbi:MAG: phosphoribosylglycinamide formyltransferase [Planctomycetales bacterium]|nr:phosphoribosylglycinamide formyltransferase [Planctomycetales bacterium]